MSSGLDDFLNSSYDSDTSQFMTEDCIPIRTLYVANINKATTEQTLSKCFEEDGPIEKITIHKTNRTCYAFVTFKNVKSANKAYSVPHFLSSRRLFIEAADSWHQPDMADQKKIQPVDENVEIDMSQSLLKLNDDCLLQIFSYLNLFDLKEIENVCLRFRNLAQITYKSYRKLDFNEIKQNQYVTLMEARNILQQIGLHVTTLEASTTKFFHNSRRLLTMIAKNCHHLEHLRLEGFNINSKILHQFKHLFGNLISLTLENCSVTDQIENYLKVANKLEHLDLSHNFEITGRCLNSLKNLKSLNLNSCANLQPRHLTHFCARNTSLTYLNIIRCDRINQQCIESIVHYLKDLEHLVICNSYPNLTTKELIIFADLEKLTKLHINFINFLNVDSFLMKLTERDNIEFLDISSGHITKNTVKALVSFKKLKVLKLNYKLDCDDVTLLRVAHNGLIRELHVVGCCSISNGGLTALIELCPQIKLINLSGCYGITNSFITSALEVLKRQAGRTDKLELIVGGTEIKESILTSEEVISNSNLIKLSFKSTFESCYTALDDIYVDGETDSEYSLSDDYDFGDEYYDDSDDDFIYFFE